MALGEEDSRVRARLDIHLDGTDLHLVHFGPGHTDGDVLVGIPAKHVIHMGDTFILGMLPIIDTEGGGSFEGLVAQIEVVASFLPEDSKVIPGHGAVSGKKELLRYRDFLRALQAHVKAGPGRKPKELAESFDTKAWPEWQPVSPFVTWESLFAAASGQGPGIARRP